jgi:hypothetical protein
MQPIPLRQAERVIPGGQEPGADFEGVVPNLKLLDQVREVMHLRHDGTKVWHPFRML